jgi:hypothetical protein
VSPLNPPSVAPRRGLQQKLWTCVEEENDEGHRNQHLGETGPLSQGVQAGRKVLRKCHINGMKVRKKGPRAPGGSRKMPRGFK